MCQIQNKRWWYVLELSDRRNGYSVKSTELAIRKEGETKGLNCKPFDDFDSVRQFSRELCVTDRSYMEHVGNTFVERKNIPHIEFSDVI